MLCAHFNETIDMWSLCLVVVELAGRTEYNTLCFINEAQGQPPDHVLDLAWNEKLCFQQPSDGQQGWLLKPPQRFWEETKYRPFKTSHFALTCLDDLEEVLVANKEDQMYQSLFLDLIKRMLHLDLDQHIKPLEVLQSLPQSSNAVNIIETVDKEETPVVLKQEQTAGLNTNGYIINIRETPAAETCENIEEVDMQLQQTSHHKNKTPTDSLVAAVLECTEELDIQLQDTSDSRTEVPDKNLSAAVLERDKVDIQPDPNVENVSCWRCFTKEIMNTFPYFFLQCG